jgi:hypothetical protein
VFNEKLKRFIDPLNQEETLKTYNFFSKKENILSLFKTLYLHQEEMAQMLKRIEMFNTEFNTTNNYLQSPKFLAKLKENEGPLKIKGVKDNSEYKFSSFQNELLTLNNNKNKLDKAILKKQQHINVAQEVFQKQVNRRLNFN